MLALRTMLALQRKTEALRRLAQGSRRVRGFGVRSFEGGWNRSKSGGVGSSGRQVGDKMERVGAWGGIPVPLGRRGRWATGGRQPDGRRVRAGAISAEVLVDLDGHVVRGQSDPRSHPQA